MIIVRNIETREFRDGDTFVAYEYATDDVKLNIARIEIKGRYPREGCMRNLEVKEIIYVEQGVGEVCINDRVTAIGKGDVVFLDVNESVFWNGEVTLIS
jgi:hypothetical protein